MIRLAKECDRQVLTKLWKNNFGDSDSFIAKFLDYVIVHGKVYVYEIEEGIVSMVSVIYGSLSGRPTHRVAYLYGVATDKAYQNRGYSSSLLKAVVAELETSNTGAILVLANPKLEKFYQRLEFLAFSKLHEFQILSLEKNEYTILEREKSKERIKDITIENYMDLRKKYCDAFPYSVGWGEHFMRLCYEDHLQEGGRVVSITYEQQEVGAWFKIEEEQVRILELTVRGQVAYEAALELCKLYQLEGCYYISEQSGNVKESTLYCMCSGLVSKWLHGQVGYMNIALNE